MREYAGICMKRNLGIRMRGNMVRGIWEGICMRVNMGGNMGGNMYEKEYGNMYD